VTSSKTELVTLVTSWSPASREYYPQIALWRDLVTSSQLKKLVNGLVTKAGHRRIVVFRPSG
jgi:hypothetical protein